MNIFDSLLLKINSLSGEKNELLETHKALWENGMKISSEQWNELLSKLVERTNLVAQLKHVSLLSEGTFYTFHPAFGNALQKLSEAEEAFGNINDTGGEGAAQALLVIWYKNNGQLDKAQHYVQKAIVNMGENKTYIHFLCITFYQAGEMCHLLGDYDAAIKYFTGGLSKANESMAVYVRLLLGLAGAYKDSNKLEKAFDVFQQALQKIEGKGIPILESKLYADLANYYYRKTDFIQSVTYHHKSIEIRERHNMKNALITNYIELAELFLEQNELADSLQYATQAEKLSKELNINLKISQVYHIISKIQEAMGNIPLALDYYKQYHHKKEEVFSQESARQIKELSMRHEMENIEKEKELFKLRNVVLKEALEEIEASVRYAQRIQNAILPPLDLIKEKLPNSFVLYKPKDIVAGDFYWMHETADTILIAAADCTGHGVPGALVSVVCSNALNRAVKEFNLTETGKILNKVRELVIDTFVKSNQDVKDGMDISLLSINKVTKQIQCFRRSCLISKTHN